MAMEAEAVKTVVQLQQVARTTVVASGLHSTGN
jgi:hypothetical protein